MIAINNLSKSADLTKMGGELSTLAAQYRLYQSVFGASAAKLFQTDQSSLQIDNGRVMVDVTAAHETKELVAQLASVGFEVTGQYGQVVSGYIPMDTMMEMVNSEAMQFMRPAHRPVTRQGSVENQGQIALRADAAIAEFNVTGKGIMVGVLSDSFDNLGGAARDRASGDLPNVNVLQDLPNGGSDEGRAMLQLITDVAPDADLAFQTAFLGRAGFAQGIVNLAEQANADIIVDDVIYLTESFFQDGIVAQAVDQVVADGTAYFSSAGNNGDTAYESAFRGSGQFFTFGNFQLETHDFDPGAGVDVFQTVTVATGAEISLSFQWASPYFSASGQQGATSDLDIFLVNSFNQVVAASVDGNLGGDPVEVLTFRNNSFSETRYRIVIGKFAGDSPVLIKYVGFGNLSIDEYDTRSGSLFGQANAKGAQAVGAAFFRESPAFGEAAPTVAPFSAVGGTPILFDANGNALATPDQRQKPEIIAPDGGNTTFFGQDTPADPDAFPNFFGTSAAAPNAAAVAALLLEAVPTASPAEVYQALQDSALDLDDPRTPGFDAGFDRATGFGLIQADIALRALIDSQPTVNESIPQTGSAQADNLLGTDGKDLIDGLAGNDRIRGAAGNGTLIGGDGDDVITGGLGNARILGGNGRDILRGEDNNNSVLDASADDQIFGGSGDDLLFGGSGNDLILGDAGDDLLWGGVGNDRLTIDTQSSSGRNTFVLTANGGTDRITDFQVGVDSIGLSGIDANRLSFDGNSILLGNSVLAVLDGVNAASVDLINI